MTLLEMMDELAQLCREDQRLATLLEEICKHPDLPELFQKAADQSSRSRLNS